MQGESCPDKRSRRGAGLLVVSRLTRHVTPAPEARQAEREPARDADLLRPRSPGVIRYKWVGGPSDCKLGGLPDEKAIDRALEKLIGVAEADGKQAPPWADVTRRAHCLLERGPVSSIIEREPVSAAKPDHNPASGPTLLLSPPSPLETRGPVATPPPSLPAALERVLSESLAQCSDRQLLDRFIESGNDAAFAALLDRHGPMLLGLCRRSLDPASHLAEDVLQATFLVLARKARSIRQRDSLVGWLCGVAARLARQARSSERAHARREQRAARERPEIRNADPAW